MIGFAMPKGIMEILVTSGIVGLDIFAIWYIIKEGRDYLSKVHDMSKFVGVENKIKDAVIESQLQEWERQGKKFSAWGPWVLVFSLCIAAVVIVLCEVL